MRRSSSDSSIPIADSKSDSDTTCVTSGFSFKTPRAARSIEAGKSSLFAARVFTIHNLAYNGDFSHDVLALAGLPESLFTYDKMEFYGRISFMKGGIVDWIEAKFPTETKEAPKAAAPEPGSLKG